MSEVEITVRGSHRAFRPAERGTALLWVGLEGPEPRSVYEGVQQSAAAVIEQLKRLHDPEHGPVTWWANKQIRTWAHRPFNRDGKQMPVVHHAVVEIDAKFGDFAELGRWLAWVSEVRGANVRQVRWTLTEVQRNALVREVRSAAVRDAAEKAQAYADALDLGPVRVSRVADAGILGGGLRHSEDAAGLYSRMSGAEAGGASAAEFAPEDIEVSAEIDAVFLAGNGG
jgi:uncharacterized protein YggE